MKSLALLILITKNNLREKGSCVSTSRSLNAKGKLRRLGDRFREHLRDVEKDDKNASKPVARHFNLPNHSKQHMVVCRLSLHQGSTERRKTLEQKIYFSNRHS